VTQTGVSSQASLETCLNYIMLALDLNRRSKMIAATAERLKKAAAAIHLTPPQNGLPARLKLGLASLQDLIKALRGANKRTREQVWHALARDYPRLTKTLKSKSNERSSWRWLAWQS